jgi:deoxyribonuclease (pyrimidine dimer)
MRINVINPKYLTDQHLIAEYREMKMITYYYLKSRDKKGGIDKSRISERYTLNTGHAYMWYNKFGYIKKRFVSICKEMRKRGFKCDYDKLNFTGIPQSAFGDFIPTKEDIQVNLDRVISRIYDKHEWYKYKGKSIENWYGFYFDLFEKNFLL